MRGQAREGKGSPRSHAPSLVERDQSETQCVRPPQFSPEHDRARAVPASKVCPRPTGVRVGRAQDLSVAQSTVPSEVPGALNGWRSLVGALTYRALVCHHGSALCLGSREHCVRQPTQTFRPIHTRCGVPVCVILFDVRVAPHPQSPTPANARHMPGRAPTPARGLPLGPLQGYKRLKVRWSLLLPAQPGDGLRSTPAVAGAGPPGGFGPAHHASWAGLVPWGGVLGPRSDGRCVKPGACRAAWEGPLSSCQLRPAGAWAELYQEVIVSKKEK